VRPTWIQPLPNSHKVYLGELRVPAPSSPDRSVSWCLSQLAYGIPGGLVHELSIGNGIPHDGIPMQPHVSRPVLALQHQSLQTPLLAEGVIRGVAKKVVDSFLPYASLHSVDDGGHASVKFARHIDRKRVFILHGGVDGRIRNLVLSTRKCIVNHHSS
jgi:hypothetical protein